MQHTTKDRWNCLARSLPARKFRVGEAGRHISEIRQFGHVTTVHAHISMSRRVIWGGRPTLEPANPPIGYTEQYEAVQDRFTVETYAEELVAELGSSFSPSLIRSLAACYRFCLALDSIMRSLRAGTGLKGMSSEV